MKETSGQKVIALHFAALQGDTDAINKLLQEGVDPNVRLSSPLDPENNSPLHLAVLSGRLKAVEALLADSRTIVDVLNSMGVTPLFIAAQEGHAALVRKLREKGANPNFCAKDLSWENRMAACVNICSPILQQTLPASGDTQPVTDAFVQGVIKEGMADLGLTFPEAVGTDNIWLFLKNTFPHQKDLESRYLSQLTTLTPLIVAIGKIQVGAVNALLEKIPGTDSCDLNLRNGRGFAPLHIAIGEKRLNRKIAAERLELERRELIIRTLLTCGANPDLPTVPQQWTPLYIACNLGFLQIARWLCNQGANVNHRTAAGYTPLMTATQKGYLSMVNELLLQTGIEVNAFVPAPQEMGGGRTALHEAVQGGYLTIAEALLKAGANVNATREDGATPLIVLAQQKHRSLDQNVDACLEVLCTLKSTFESFDRFDTQIRFAAGIVYHLLQHSNVWAIVIRKVCHLREEELVSFEMIEHLLLQKIASKDIELFMRELSQQIPRADHDPKLLHQSPLKMYIPIMGEKRLNTLQEALETYGVSWEKLAPHSQEAKAALLLSIQKYCADVNDNKVEAFLSLIVEAMKKQKTFACLDCNPAINPLSLYRESGHAHHHTRDKMCTLLKRALRKLLLF